MKNFYFILLNISFIFLAEVSFGQTFCPISYTDDAFITDVLIDGSSIRSSGTDGGYVNTGVTFNLMVGQTFSVTTERTGDGAFTYFHQVWFDWNDDGVFEDFYNMGSNTGSPNSETQAGIIVPPSAAGNTLRMRTTLNFNTYLTSSPCNSDGGKTTWGEVEDYEIIVMPSCAATVAFSRTCNSDLTYEVVVNITDLNGNTAIDITDGTTTYFSNVGVGTYTVTGLLGAQIISAISTSAPSCLSNSSYAACDICTLPTVPSDECINAPLIDLSQSFYGSTNCSYTVSAGSPLGCGSMDNDSWISFIAGDDTVSLDYTVGDCNPIDDGIQLVVFSGSCGSLSELPGSCVNPTGENITGNWTFSGMSIGLTYYIRIDGFAGDLCDYSFLPIEGIAVTPPNDSCFQATTINCGEISIASIVLATDNDAPAGCTGGGTPGKGAWYELTGTGGDITISTDNPGTDFDTELNLYSGTDCNSLACVAGDNNSGSGTTSEITFTSTNGQSYFIYVDGNAADQGDFELSVSCTACAASSTMTWD